MNLREIAEKLGLEVITGKTKLDCPISGGYASDLLSDVLANSREGNVWITIQAHPNIVAIAAMKGLCGVIIANGRVPEEETIKKAESENIAIMTSKKSVFELAGNLYALGVGGTKK